MGTGSGPMGLGSLMMATDQFVVRLGSGRADGRWRRPWGGGAGRCGSGRRGVSDHAMLFHVKHFSLTFKLDSTECTLPPPSL